MKSHQNDFQPKDVLRIIAIPLAGLALLAVLIHFGVWSQLLPPPRPALDLDRTILVHQAEAAQSPQQAEVVLLGDSSCLMNVMAGQLTSELGHPVLNLGTLSYLGLATQTVLLKEFVRANPGRLRTVVLLMHPEALRRVSGDEESYHNAVVDGFLAGRDHCPASGLGGRISCGLGLESFRARVLSRLIPSPLPATNDYGRAYRFTSGLEQFMVQHRGSLVEPAQRSFTGNPEYRLAAGLEKQSRALAAAIPPGVLLSAGITPVPASFVEPDFTQQHAFMLTEWSQWLGAVPLKLPATMPDENFGRVTHLNASGARSYTRLLAQSLAKALSVHAHAPEGERTSPSAQADP